MNKENNINIKINIKINFLKILKNISLIRLIIDNKVE